ncbi:hypothetical protein ACHAXS_003750, partial [Conticribra weissflogii]
LQLVLHLLGIKSRHGETGCKLIDPLSQPFNLLISIQKLHKINQLRPTFFLNLQCDTQSLMQEQCYLLKVALNHFPRCQGWSSNTNSSGSDSGPISRHAVFVQSDCNGIASLFKFRSGDFLWLQVPEHKVVLGSTGGESVSQFLKLISKRRGIRTNLLCINLEFWSHDLQKLGGHTGNLMFVRTPLQCGEDRLVDAVFESTLVFAEENHSGAGSAEGLVGGGCDDVAEFEGRFLFLGGDEPGDVSHVHEEEGAVIVGNFAEAFVVPVTGISGSSADDHGGFEEGGIAFELVVVDESGDGVNLVGKTLEVDGGGADGLAGALLLAVGVESVGQVPAGGKIQAHDAVMGTQQSGVDGKVGGTSRVRLHVDAPLLGVQSVGLQSALLAEDFDLVNDFVSAVVTGMGETFGVFVGESGSETFHHGSGGEVLRGDELERGVLAELFLLDQVEEFWVMFGERLEAGEFLLSMFATRI